MHKDHTPPIDPLIDPDLREALRQFEPGPLGNEGPLQDMTARVDTDWEALAARIADPAVKPLQGKARIQPPMTVGRSWLTASVLMASVACVLIAIGIGMWMARSGSSEKSPSSTFATKPGQQMTVRLADGSTVLLAPATSVTVSMPVVEVRGAAYFTVTPRASRSLVVTTRNAVARVLGTRFEVRQYADESASRVVVEDGRVALQSLGHDQDGRRDVRRNVHQNQAVVSAGMMAQVSDSGVTLTSGGDTEAVTGWVRGILVFDGAPLRQVVAEVGRAYGVSVLVADSMLAKRSVVAEVDVRHLSLIRVLNLLGEAVSAHHVEDRGAFVLVPGRRAQNDTREKSPNDQFPQPERQYGR